MVLVELSVRRVCVGEGGHKPGKPGNLEYPGNYLNLENSWNSQGILYNLREKL